VTIAGVGGP